MEGGGISGRREPGAVGEDQGFTTAAKVADLLHAADLELAERAALDEGVTVRSGQGYALRVSAVPAVHRQLLARCQSFDTGQGVPAVSAQRKARREHENRASALTPAGP
ncbi:hypothetical protein GCM10022254_11850 [Actinomadura meridiana]|uniref:Uncharacterized protein n=1 Tax=Actinomadura meridiana TaxID=559626 RepID=A0ABP8BUS1_9ACTN